MRGGRLRAAAVVFGQAWRAKPALTAVVVALAVLDALRPMGAAVVTGVLIDRATSGRSLLLPLAVFAGLHALPIGEARWRTSDLLGNHVGDVLDQRVMEAFLRPAGIAHLNDSEVQDAAARAVTFWNSSILEGITSVGVTRLSGVGAAIVLVSLGVWWAALPLAVVWVIAGMWSWDRARQMLDVHFDKVPEVRKAEYARDLVFRPEAAKDIRAFGVGNWIVDRYVDSWTRAMSELWRSRRRAVIPSAAIAGAIAAVHLVVFLLLGRRALDGSMSTATLAVAIQGVLGMVDLGSVPYGHYEMEYGLRTVPANEQLSRLVDAPRFQLVGSRAADGLTQAAIEFREVSFRYPGRDLEVLRNVSLRIDAGSSLAIVGDNGAGKSTLVKLLCRYFDPSSGSITLDGTDLREFDPRAWQARIAGLFQEFVHYPLSARDNLALGHPVDDRVLERAARRASITEILARLPAGLSTPLTRGFEEGVDLSGGEWQRVALARALVAVQLGAGLLILDEPTAHLDARAEAELYENFLELSEGATTVVISHRFSTVRRANHIAVLADGEIVEYGTHGELVGLGGRYAAMFRAQASRFSDA